MKDSFLAVYTIQKERKPLETIKDSLVNRCDKFLIQVMTSQYGMLAIFFLIGYPYSIIIIGSTF